jgi:hypothetical protein
VGREIASKTFIQVPNKLIYFAVGKGLFYLASPALSKRHNGGTKQ